MKKCFYFFLTLLLFNFLNAVEENKSLQAEDVKHVMQEILNRHGDEEGLSEKIIKNSFKIYIDQFDPRRIYLLESEVDPYLNPSSIAINQVMSDWKSNRFTQYERLNSVIEEAIERAQNNRKNFNVSPSENEPKNEFKSVFAKNLEELNKRQKSDYSLFLERKRQKLGNEAIVKQQDKLMQFYEEAMRGHEKEYLLKRSPNISRNQESLFYMHVLKGLTKSLDAHTTYLNNQEAFDMKVRLEKSMDGIGIILSKGENGFVIAKILEGSPARENGKIHENDLLVKINGEPIQDKDTAEVINQLRGKAGTEVLLTVKGEGKPFENVRLMRKTFLVNEGRVTYRYIPVNGGIIGVVKLASFYQNDAGISAEADIRRAISELSTKGHLKGLVLDLRENSGGFLTQAVKVAGLFITNGVVVISKYSNGEERFYRDMDGKISYDGPLVILTSKITASAAEIVAQALQDYGVALVVGDEQTYGKGTIQSQTVTEGDGNSYFKVTVGKYYTVSGQTPQEKGVKADIIVPSILDGEQIGEEYLESHLSNDHINSAYQDTLNDVNPSIRPWYLRYYVPTLQKKSLHWKEGVTSFREKSHERLKEENYLRKLHDNDYDMKDDLQLLETVNIVKDMISYEAKMHGSGVTTVDNTLKSDK